jgi:hypothetical protein
MMDLGKIKDLRLAHPFRPFYLLMNDGERLFVEHPLSLGIASDGSHMMFSSRSDKKARHFGLADVKDVDVLPKPLKN